MLNPIELLIRFLTAAVVFMALISSAHASVVRYEGEVTAEGMNQLVAKVAKLANAGDRNITVSLNSGGGNLVAALKASRLLKQYGVHTTAYNDCSSSCTVLFAAGVNRSASSSTTFLFHAVKVAKKSSKLFSSGSSYKLSSSAKNEFVTKYANLWLDAVREVSPSLADKLRRDNTLTKGSKEYSASSLRKFGYVNN